MEARRAAWRGSWARKKGRPASGPIEGPRGKPVTTIVLAITQLPRIDHIQRRRRRRRRKRRRRRRGTSRHEEKEGRHYRVSDSRLTRRSLIAMQAALMAIGLLLALFCPPTCALISRSRFSRPSTLRATLECKQTPRSMVTSLATAQLNQPEPPAVKSPIDVGQLAMLALMVVFLIIQLSQGATQVSQGAMLTALSTKFDQVTYFVVGVIALAAFGNSVVSILKYFDDIKEKKERRGRE